MCEPGAEHPLIRVPIDPRLAHDGKFRWDFKPVDRCISGLVELLIQAGLYTSNSCCGHGKSLGEIVLHDGTVISLV